MKRLSLLLLLACAPAFGQAARFDGVALSTTSTGNPLTTVAVPLASAIITVCNYPANGGLPCTNKAPACPDITAVGCTSTSPNNPITADARGNFGFWIAPGAYQYTVCPVSGVCQGPYNALVPLGVTAPSTMTITNLGIGPNSNLATGQAFGMKCDGVTDDSAALVAAGKFSATVGRTVYIIPDSSGHSCVIKSQALFAFAPTDTFVNGPRFECVSGATFDDQVANNSMILIMSTVPSKFVAHTLLQGCTIKTTTNPANSTGYELQRAWYSEIRGNRITGLSGAGLKLTDLSADPGSTQISEVFQNEIISNTGDGITLVTTNGNASVGLTIVRENRIAFNGGNGITVNGARGTHFEHNSIALNTGNGIEFTATSGCNSITPSIIGGSFDTNGLSGAGKGHIAYDCGNSLTVMGVEFDHSVTNSGCGVTNAACHTEFDIKSGDGVNSGTGLTATGNYHRLDDTTTPANYYNLTSTSSRAVISQAYFDRALAAGQNKYADASALPSQDQCYEFGQYVSCDSVSPGRPKLVLDSTAGAAIQFSITGPDGTHASTLTDNGGGMAFTESGSGNFTFTGVAASLMDIPPIRGREVAAPSGIANSDLLYPDSTAHRWKMKNNNGSAVQVVGSGSDIDASDNVTSTHLASALPVNQGGTGVTTSTGSTNVVLSNSPTLTGTAAMGSATFSGSVTIGASGSAISDSRALVQSVFECGTTTTCANTPNNSDRIIHGNVALSSASPSTATVASISPAFTSTATYNCTATPEGATAAIAAGGIAISKVSGSSFTLTGPNTVTTVIDYTCIGH